MVEDGWVTTVDSVADPTKKWSSMVIFSFLGADAKASSDNFFTWLDEVVTTDRNLWNMFFAGDLFVVSTAWCYLTHLRNVFGKAVSRGNYCWKICWCDFLMEDTCVQKLEFSQSQDCSPKTWKREENEKDFEFLDDSEEGKFHCMPQWLVPS